MTFIHFVLRFVLPKFVFGILLLPLIATSQTLGGRAAYNFLQLPSSPLQAAAGGVNISYRAEEVGLTTGNPALLSSAVSNQLNASFNALLAGAKGYNLTGAFFSKKLQATFGGHLAYYDYGAMPATDAAGNVLGEFRPADYVVQASAAKQYLQRWTYGISLAFIHSAYGVYRSSAVAADVGILYQDSANGITAAVVAKNMGGQLKTYAGQAEELPFDLQAGFTKRLAKAPIGFSLTAWHLQTFDILYRDTVYNWVNNFSAASSSAVAKMLSHLVLGTHLYLGQYMEASVGYNVLQRKELNIDRESNGLAGFSAGLRIRLPTLQILYARSGYQRGLATNQIGLTVHLNRLAGLGR